MSFPSLEDQLKESCIHYRGASSLEPCRKGLDTNRFELWDTTPCMNGNQEGTEACPEAEYMTAEQIQKKVSEIMTIGRKFGEDLKNWICPRCGTDIQKELQIGQCFYAEPCGCRIAQGKARGVRPEKK